MRIVVAGATGFIGRRVVHALSAAGHDVTALVHHSLASSAAQRTVRVDLASGEGLETVLEGASVVVHAASYVGPDPLQQHCVNVDGTEQLLTAARAADIGMIVYVSTAGVYGSALAAGGDEIGLRAEPRSTLSLSRREAEIRVLDYGGTVLRPNMVTGSGDRWFLLPLLQVMRRTGAWIERGEPRISVVDVDVLGKVAAALATQAHPPGIYHVAHPTPVTIRELVSPAYERAGDPLPSRSLTHDEAWRLLEPLGVTQSQLAIVARDNWFDTSKLWRQLPELRPDGASRLREADVEWYLSTLQSEDSPIS